VAPDAVRRLVGQPGNSMRIYSAAILPVGRTLVQPLTNQGALSATYAPRLITLAQEAQGPQRDGKPLGALGREGELRGPWHRDSGSSVGLGGIQRLR
jgi:hypothetical protein